MIELNINIPDSFLDEEERCGYIVSKQMKEVWAVELDLLAELLRVCKKHGIKVFASGGTMLGAIRHKGFIPWDDDIDMMMFRSDYDKLCAIAAEEFVEPYFFQTEYTDRGSLRRHAQLRNSRTTGILTEEFQKGYTFNQGIFIDIFPLDYVIDDKGKFQKQYKEANKYNKLYSKISRVTTRFQKNNSPLLKKAVHVIMTYLNDWFGLEEKYYRKFEKACQKYNNIPSKMISTLSLDFNNKQHFKYMEDYQTLIDVDFEFLKIPVGSNYDHALRKRYGDYLKFERGTSTHGNVIFDTNKSYIDYLNDTKE